MTLLGGLAFGPVRGAAYVWIAATIGAALAFLVARYGLRGLVEGWVARNARLARIDEAVARDGWRIVMITRLVPLFPFNLQNYTYGVTRIGFWAYLSTSAVCMIPATVAYTFAGGALSRGGGDLRWTLGYLAVAGVLIVLVSLIPRYLERRNRAAGALLKMAILLPVLAALGAGPPPVHAGDAAHATPTFTVFVKKDGFVPLNVAVPGLTVCPYADHLRRSRRPRQADHAAAGARLGPDSTPGVSTSVSPTPSVVRSTVVPMALIDWVRDERKRKNRR